MYLPKYTITNQILNAVSKVEAAKEIIENSPLIPLWERDFILDAKTRTVHYSTHLEGNPLKFPEVKRIIEGFENEIVARNRDVYEVINYREVMQFIENIFVKSKESKLTSQDIFDLDLICKIHSILSKKILPDDRHGKIRVKNANLISSKDFKSVLTFPPVKEILPLLRDLVSWVRSSDTKKIHPVLKSGVVHYELTKIHPFDDQNGRTARALSTLVLFLDGYDIKSFFCLDEHFDTDPLGYYKALSSVQEKYGDLTHWLEYFTLALAIELNRVKEKVLKLSKDAKLKGVIGKVYLSERQETILNYLSDYGFLNNKRWQKLFPNYSDDTILRDLADLIKKRVIKKEGKTKSSKYVLR